MQTTQAAMPEHLSPELAQVFLEGLPQTIRNGLEMRAKRMNYPVWAVIEMAIAGYSGSQIDVRFSSAVTTGVSAVSHLCTNLRNAISR